MFWGRKGAKPGVKLKKTCSYPNKSRYKCNIRGMIHLSGCKDKTMTFLHISPKFAMFWGRKAAKPGVNWRKTCSYLNKSHYECNIRGMIHLSE